MFTIEELKYLLKCLNTTTDYTRARAEQIETTSVNHKQLEQKIKDLLHRLTV